jgi:hypothetical protein
MVDSDPDFDSASDSDTSPNPPAVPERRLAESGWARTETTAETVASLAGVDVTAHTVVYDDLDLRRRVIEAGSPDRVWRFFFASRLTFSPALSASVARFAKSTILRRSREGFADELRERGFEAVAADETTDLDLGDGTTAGLTEYDAVFEAEEETIPITGGAAAWHDGTFYVAGGAYPTDGLGVDLPVETYETELRELIRAVAENVRR